jgi:hypothetical protein
MVPSYTGGSGSAGGIEFYTSGALGEVEPQIKALAKSYREDPMKKVFIDACKTTDELRPNRLVHRAYDFALDMEQSRQPIIGLDGAPCPSAFQVNSRKTSGANFCSGMGSGSGASPACGASCLQQPSTSNSTSSIEEPIGSMTSDHSSDRAPYSCSMQLAEPNIEFV